MKKVRIETKNYTRVEFLNTVIVPKWQRWRNESNVKDLAEAVKEQGQMRDVLVCVTPDGNKILTDGAHLQDAMLNILRSKTISVKERYVKDDNEAREVFISFNTRGRSLSTMDYVVSFASSENKSYSSFLKDVMQSPSNLKEAKAVHSKLFTEVALINIFLGNKNKVQGGQAKLPRNYDRLVEIVEYLGCSYLKNQNIINHTNKNGKGMKLNGGSIQPVMNSIKGSRMLLNKTNSEILKMLVDFTIYHYNSMEAPSFSKDAVAASFSSYLKKEIYV